ASGIASESLTLTNFDFSNIGTNLVTLTVTTNINTRSLRAAILILVDLIAPVAVCQDLRVELNANGQGTIDPAQINNGSTDACGIARLSLSQTNFDCSNIGTNLVTLTVTDNNGNSSTCTATVTVVDLIAPVA